LFPRGQQVYGPSQINALIDQDTTIAEMITLWDQHGSEVRRGKMIIFPLGKHILYIQPFYLEATGRLKIPELKRVIVSVEEIVIIDVTLEKAFERLNKILTERKAGKSLTPAGPLPHGIIDQQDEVPPEPDQKTDPYLEPTESDEEEMPDHVSYHPNGHEDL